VRQVVHPRSGALVVDVGCGTGANLASLMAEYRCLGIDSSLEAVDLARRRFPEIRFICGFAPDGLGNAAEEASVFLLMDVLEHVEDDFAMLSRLASSRPGAHVLITVPANESLWSEHDVSFGHYRRYDQTRLEAVWSGLPVTPRLVSHINCRLYPAVRALRALSRVRGHSSGAAATDVMLPPPPVNRMLQRIFGGEAQRRLPSFMGAEGVATAGESVCLRCCAASHVNAYRALDRPRSPPTGTTHVRLKIGRGAMRT
jgi:SAM-dependent methyltransferase